MSRSKEVFRMMRPNKLRELKSKAFWRELVLLPRENFTYLCIGEGQTCAGMVIQQ